MTDHVAIVGGGIAGASTACHLAASTDARVTVFERDALCAETTAKSTAVFRLQGDPTARAMKRHGMAMYNRFLAEPTGDPAYVRTGRLEVATTGPGAARLAERATALRTGAYLEGDEVPGTVLFPELDADAIAGALYDGNVGYFRPVELAHEFVDRARRRGVEFRTGTAVSEVETVGRGVEAVHTATERVPVSTVIAAAGPWNRDVGRLAGVEFPIRHSLAPILALEPTPPLAHTLPSLRHVESGYYAVGRTDGSVLVGHTPGGYQDAGRTLDPDDVPGSVPDDVRSGAIDVLGQLVPSLLDADLVDEWVGLRSLTPDGLPLVGPTAVEGFSIVAFNSEGIQLAPAAGAVAAARVVGSEPPAYASAVSPSRFRDEGEDP